MTFIPPRMPAPLLQELYWPDPWKCMVICIMLNCTQRKQVEPMIDEFFAYCPSAVDFCIKFPVDCEEDDHVAAYGKKRIIEMLRPLGFYNRRAERIFRFSMDFIYNFASVEKGELDIRRLYGVGEYAARCYEMLFLGQFGEEAPQDHALTNYWKWYTENHGQKSP